MTHPYGVDTVPVAKIPEPVVLQRRPIRWRRATPFLMALVWLAYALVLDENWFEGHNALSVWVALSLITVTIWLVYAIVDWVHRRVW